MWDWTEDATGANGAITNEGAEGAIGKVHSGGAEGVGVNADDVRLVGSNVPGSIQIREVSGVCTAVGVCSPN